MTSTSTSDPSPASTQLTRVIENLLCFQAASAHPERIVFTLLTPSYFKDARHRRTRLYGYKFAEFVADRGAIIEDLDLCMLERRTHSSWAYPEVGARLEHLQLHWASYEEIFALESELAGIDVVGCARDAVRPAVVVDRVMRSVSDSLSDGRAGG